MAGGRLADDLSLPRLRRRWASLDALPGSRSSRISPYQRRILWEDAAAVAAAAAAEISALAHINPERACDTAWAAADMLHVCAQELASFECRRAARAFDRAAREPYRRLPRPTLAGGCVRTVARALAAGGLVDRESTAWIMTLTGVMRLLGAVAELRQAQARPVQAASARWAAEHLAAIATHAKPRRVGGAGVKVPGAARRDFPTVEPGRGAPEWDLRARPAGPRKAGLGGSGVAPPPGLLTKGDRASGRRHGTA